MSHLFDETKQAFTELICDAAMVRLFKDWLIEESYKADNKAHYVGGQFNLGYAAGLDVCLERFIEYIDGKHKK